MVFSAVAINLLNGSDRYIIKFLIGEKVLGLYELGYRVGGIINMMMIIPFNLSLLPLAYKIYQTDGDQNYYKKLKTYLAFVLLWAGLALSLFSKEIVEIFALNSSYYSAYLVVPYIILAYILYGISNISSLGMFLSGKNIYMAFIINIGLNFWLIPHYGIIAAAINTVIAFFIQDILSIIASNKHYKIKYEYLKITKLFIVGFALFIAANSLSSDSLLVNISIKLIISLIFPLVCFAVRCFEKRELKIMKKVFLKWKNPKDWLKNFQVEMKDLKS